MNSLANFPLRCTTLAFALLLMLAAPVIAQTQTTLSQSHRGWVRDDGNHSPSNPNYASGDDWNFTGYRNFFIFDLAAINAPIGSAELRLDNPNAQGTGNFTVYEVSTAPSVSATSNAGRVARPIAPIYLWKTPHARPSGIPSASRPGCKGESETRDHVLLEGARRCTV